MLPKPWPPDHALRKVEALCAIHKANVTVALLFQKEWVAQAAFLLGSS